MGYHIDDEAMDLEAFAERLESCDPIPSHLPLLDGLREKLAAMRNAGVASVAALRRELKRPSSLSAFAGRTGIAEGYLVLLRRAVEGWFPKPPSLSDFPGVDPAVVEVLARAGALDARSLIEAASAQPSRSALAAAVGVGPEGLDELVALADLSRLQWVSPPFARLLYDAGYAGTAAVAAADGDTIYEAVRAINEDGRYFKGAIGKRDMARLVSIARSLSRWT